MNLVDEEDRILAHTTEPFRLVYYFLQVLDAGGDGREVHASRTDVVGENLRQSSFTAPGRAPKNQRSELAAINHLGQNSPRTEDMLLSDEFVQVSRAHPFCQGCSGRLLLGLVGFKQIHGGMLAQLFGAVVAGTSSSCGFLGPAIVVRSVFGQAGWPRCDLIADVVSLSVLV